MIDGQMRGDERDTIGAFEYFGADELHRHGGYPSIQFVGLKGSNFQPFKMYPCICFFLNILVSNVNFSFSTNKFR